MSQVNKAQLVNASAGPQVEPCNDLLVQSFPTPLGDGQSDTSTTQVWSIRRNPLVGENQQSDTYSTPQMLEIISRAEACVEAELQWNDTEVSNDPFRSLLTKEYLQALKILHITVQWMESSWDTPVDQAAMDEATENCQALQNVKKMIDLCQKLDSDVDKYFPQFLASAPELDPSLDRFHIDLRLRKLTPEHLSLIGGRVIHLQKMRNAGVFSMAIVAHSLPQAQGKLTFCLCHQAAEYLVTIVKVAPDGDSESLRSSKNQNGSASLASSASSASKRTGRMSQPYVPINLADVEKDLAAGRTLMDCFHRYRAENGALRTYGKSSFFNKISGWQKTKASDGQASQAP